MPNDQEKASFIPTTHQGESQTASRKRRGGDLLVLVTFGLFIVALLAAVGLFFYKQHVQSNLADRQQEINQARSALEAELIDELGSTQNRIETAKELLNNHIALTPVFPIVEEVTLGNVQFTSMDISYKEAASASNESATGPVAGRQPQETEGPPSELQESPDSQTPVSTTGQAGGERAPETSDSDSKNGQDNVTISLEGVGPGYATIALQSSQLAQHDLIEDPVLSDFQSNNQGNVEFSVTFSISADKLRYKDTI